MSSKLGGLLPHAAPMLLVDELISSTHHSAVVGVTIRDSYPFSQGEVGTWLGIELMAQSAAVLSKIRGQQQYCPYSSVYAWPAGIGGDSVGSGIPRAGNDICFRRY